MAAAVEVAVEVAAMEVATAMAEEVDMVEEGEDTVAVATQVGMLNTSPPSPTAPMISIN